MFKRIFIRNLRQPLSNLTVILFAAVLSVVLCWLNRTQAEELRSYEEACASVPVYFKVTDLDGSEVSSSDGIISWFEDLFTGTKLKQNLIPYVGELHARAPYRYVEHGTGTVTVYGITSTRVAPELTPDRGGSIHWNEGYDESILLTEEFVCLVPEGLQDSQEVELHFCYYKTIGADRVKESVTATFPVVGYYTDYGNTSIYIPYATLEQVCAKAGQAVKIEALGAVLKDNKDLEALREDAACWFAVPNPMGTPTAWGGYGYENYPYALDIDDTMLRNLQTEMQNSIRMNQIAAAIVFALSAGAGFLTGFLVIRSRKREIALMRTMGASQSAIYLELAMEQLICIAAGILVGGSYALWQPLGKLCIFGSIYFAGLTAALLIFLHKNLLTTIKEDE